MSMMINPFVFAAPSGSITLGEDNAGTADNTAAANNQRLAIVQATQNGEINFVHVRAASVATNEQFYLAVYQVASYTDTTGTLLASARSAALGANEVRTLELSAQVTITSGNYYAFAFLPAGDTQLRTRAGRSRSRLFADTFTDGPLATSPAGSSWSVEPIIWGTTTGTDWEGSATLGATAGNTTDDHMNANFFFGKPFVAGQSGTISALTVLGHTTTATTGNYRLAIYELAGSPTNWTGSTKLGETATQNSILADETKTVSLTSAVSVTKGRMYIVGLHSDGNVFCKRQTGGGAFGDTFSDGSAATAGTGGTGSTVPVVYGAIN